jgi:VanZ family protein
MLLSVLAGIFWLSDQPSLKLVPPLFPCQDKLLHAIEFFVLGALLFLNRDLYHPRIRWTGMILSGVVWAALDEVHQSFVVGRDCSSGDFLADCAGLLLILAISARFRSNFVHSENPADKTGTV